MNNITIIGAGTSGILASILLAKKGYKITLLEKEKKLLRKLRITGNGKCNITNLNINNYNFHSSSGEIGDFIVTYEEVEKLFLELSIPFISLEDGRVFPMSMEANGVAEILEYQAKKSGVEIINECEVLGITKGFEITTSKGIFKTNKLILATGHKAGRVGGSDKVLEFVENLGHTIIKPYPSLVQLETEQDFTKCSGVKIKVNLSLFSNGELIKQTYGDLLFTNYGISGLSVLDISVGVAQRLENYEYLEISVDFFRDYNKEKLKSLLNKLDKTIPIGMALRGIIPAKLIPFILQEAQINSKILTNKDINKLIYSLKNFKIEIIATKDFKSAEVVSGGISLNEINPNTMESKKIKNLYLLGEMIDVDGDRGGYNLHFAWSSAIKLSETF